MLQAAHASSRNNETMIFGADNIRAFPAVCFPTTAIFKLYATLRQVLVVTFNNLMGLLTTCAAVRLLLTKFDRKGVSVRSIASDVTSAQSLTIRYACSTGNRDTLPVIRIGLAIGARIECVFAACHRHVDAVSYRCLAHLLLLKPQVRSGDLCLLLRLRFQGSRRLGLSFSTEC